MTTLCSIILKLQPGESLLYSKDEMGLKVRIYNKENMFSEHYVSDFAVQEYPNIIINISKVLIYRFRALLKK